MSHVNGPDPIDRRSFLRGAAGVGGAALAALYAGVPSLHAAPSTGAALAGLRDDIGLQLFTVRDQFVKDYAGTLMKVGQIGYRQVQTTLSYAVNTPKQVREYLDAAGLTAPTTHVSPPADDFEREGLEHVERSRHRRSRGSRMPKE